MPRELAVFGILIPTLLPVFVLCMALQVGLDRILGKLGFYRHVWHPALVRLCLLVCLFGMLLRALYR